MIEQGTIINYTDVGDIRFYKERWKAVEEIEQQELRALIPKRNWKHLNSIFRRAKRLVIKLRNDGGEMDVFNRWSKIRKHYGYETL